MLLPKPQPLTDFVWVAPERHRLSTGVPLSLVRSTREEVIRLDVLVRGGTWHQDKCLQAVMTNRLLREGTTRLGSSEIAVALDNCGAVLEQSATAHYSFLTLYCLRKHFAELLGLVHDMLNCPTFDEKQFRIVLDMNRQHTIINDQRVEMIAHRRLSDMLFGQHHPLGHVADVDDFDRIGVADLRSFWQQRYCNENLSAYLSGNVTDSDVALVEAQLRIVSNPYAMKSNGVIANPQSSADDFVRIDGSDRVQGCVQMGVVSIPATHPDYGKLNVAVTALGGYFASRLMRNIRERNGWTYGISASLVNYPGMSVLRICAEASTGYLGKIVTEVRNEIDKMGNELMSEDELMVVRNCMIADWNRTYEGALSLADIPIFTEMSGQGMTSLHEVMNDIITITPAEIQRVMQQYICKQILKVVLVG